jgi:beta-lactamase class D
MESVEVQPVVATMRKQGWFVGCLYNQETNETPQLYFAHILKRGDAYTLAAEIRRGLDQTDAA